MKKLAILFVLLVLFCSSTSAQNQRLRKDITADEFKTLLDTQSEQLSIMGFNLSLTRASATALLRRSAKLIGEQDKDNPGRIYVYEKTSSGAKGKAVLYLIWDGQVTMRRITVFEDFQPYLTPEFRKLFTAEALDKDSQFAKDFIGTPDRSAVTLEVQVIGYTHITYYFDKIGVELTRKIKNGKDEGMVFALVRSKSEPKPKRVSGKRG